MPYVPSSLLSFVYFCSCFQLIIIIVVIIITTIITILMYNVHTEKWMSSNWPGDGLSGTEALPAPPIPTPCSHALSFCRSLAHVCIAIVSRRPPLMTDLTSSYQQQWHQHRWGLSTFLVFIISKSSWLFCFLLCVLLNTLIGRFVVL